MINSPRLQVEVEGRVELLDSDSESLATFNVETVWQRKCGDSVSNVNTHWLRKSYKKVRILILYKS